LTFSVEYQAIVILYSGDNIMVYEFNVVIEKDEDGFYVASVPALRGCHTQAKSLDVLMKRVKEVIALCLEMEEPVSNEFIGVQRVAVSK
jgi:predicted RNase H-like HicB family nuclease